jgi:hypothetical protein
MASGVTFGQLPAEEGAFLAYLQSTGDVWARAVWDDPVSPKYEPSPVAEFLAHHAREIAKYDSVDIYIGFREDVCHPETCFYEVTEGGTSVPLIQDGRVVDGVQTIVGGTKVQREFLNVPASPLVRYKRGEFCGEDLLASSNLSFYTGTYRDQVWVAQPASFLKWGKKILDWMRRHTPESVPVDRCHYEMRATTGVAAACRNGVKLRAG